jgi:uncharacterized protein
MRYRSFGRLGFPVSVLGFGAMRLPVVDGRNDQIDRDEARRLLHAAIDGGVTYVDTAWPYHGGSSEEWLGWALQDGYRERVKVATKLPTWLVEGPDDFDRYLAQQLERLGTGIDVYLFHGLDGDRWHDRILAHGAMDAAERALADGRIAHLGFSFHGTSDEFVEIIDGSDLWECCQIQYNFMDEEYQAGTKGLEYAAEKGLGIVVMEPLRGGRLARPTPDVAAIWAAAARDLGSRPPEDVGLPESPAEWALRWVWDRPEVATVLSGMSTFEQVEQNLRHADGAVPRSLTAAEHAVIARVRDAYRAAIPIPCTACNYCLPCPNRVAIPDILELYNDAMAYGEPRASRLGYAWIHEEERADHCTQCGECEDRCPQGIAIPAWLEKAEELLTEPSAGE